MNSTPGTSSAIPSSIYLLTTYDHTKEKAPSQIGLSKFDPNFKKIRCCITRILNLIDLLAQLLSDFSLPWLHHLAHKGQNILASLRLGICGVKVMQCNVLCRWKHIIYFFQLIYIELENTKNMLLCYNKNRNFHSMLLEKIITHREKIENKPRWTRLSFHWM